MEDAELGQEKAIGDTFVYVDEQMIKQPQRKNSGRGKKVLKISLKNGDIFLFYD